ncbi:baeRF2 domain-containing protein [Streptomyces sp. NPDC002587]
MKLQFLTPLFAHPGPIASVYLDTSRGRDDPDRAMELRWRKLRRSLLAHDADQATVEAIADAVGTDREVAGPHGQAVFAAHGKLVLAETLPEPPARDTALYGMLPDTLSLALQHAPDIPYTVVILHRVHVPERTAGHGGPDEELEIDSESGRWPTSRVAPGARSHRRIPVDGWPEAVVRLVGELVAEMDAAGTEMVVVAGDPWAVNSLMRAAPSRLHGAFVKLKDGQHRRREPGRALLEEELAILLDGRLSDRDRHQVDTFLAQRARHPEYVEGCAAGVAALQRGQAQTLILNRPVRLHRHLWVGAAPVHLALTGEELSAFGLHYYWEEPAPGAALIRAAAGTQAELICVPDEELPIEDGVAVVLRYTGS